jgi:hypothetical protein
MAAKRVGRLGDPADPRSTIDGAALGSVASALGLTVITADAKGQAEFETAVASGIGQRLDAILSGATTTANLREPLIGIANRRRLAIGIRLRVRLGFCGGGVPGRLHM